ncbi:MAG: glycosyltransferase family protein [Candidatus Hodarchaeales archaeon]|jgi:hypothetical protein
MTDSKNYGVLEHNYQQALNNNLPFKYRAILFIGSESYDGACITLMQGLQELGFTIYTINKPNINSWFVNTVIDDPHKYPFDFVLSNLHWGTRWSHYERFGLQDCLCVLLDGDDNRGIHGWRRKYERLTLLYPVDPPEQIRDMKSNAPFRWLESLGDYDPDVVFTTQHNLGDTHYFPFGIQREYLQYYQAKKLGERRIDWAHFPGPGEKRSEMESVFYRLSKQDVIKGTILGSNVTGEKDIPIGIQELVDDDYSKNIHSYHRWVTHRGYFDALNDTKFLIYPGVTNTNWDSKRPWEALASGCLFLMADPGEFTAQYPIQDLMPTCFYSDMDEFKLKVQFLQAYPAERARVLTHEKAIRYFSPVPLARYFLWKMMQ